MVESYMVESYMVESYMVEGYRVSTHKSDMDLHKIYAYISVSYWAKGISKDVLQRAINNSLCFAVLSEHEGLVGFARMITDRATFAYLADVFISENHRGKGLSKWLLTEIMAHPELQGLRRMALATRDAHDLYKEYGFMPLSDPDVFMEKWNADVYS